MLIWYVFTILPFHLPYHDLCLSVPSWVLEMLKEIESLGNTERSHITTDEGSGHHTLFGLKENI